MRAAATATIELGITVLNNSSKVIVTIILKVVVVVTMSN